MTLIDQLLSLVVLSSLAGSLRLINGLGLAQPATGQSYRCVVAQRPQPWWGGNRGCPLEQGFLQATGARKTGVPHRLYSKYLTVSTGSQACPFACPLATQVCVGRWQKCFPQLRCSGVLVSGCVGFCAGSHMFWACVKLDAGWQRPMMCHRDCWG